MMGPSYEELIETVERLEARVLDLEHREHELLPRWNREPDWSKAPWWANWWAVAYDGEACWFDDRPTLNKDGVWIWTTGKYECIPGYLPEPKDPKSTLRERPGAEEEPVSPEEFTPNWDEAPEGYNWYAVDPDNNAYWFRCKPVWSVKFGDWRNSPARGPDYAEQGNPEYYPGIRAGEEVAKTLLFKRPSKTK